jgi:hypothetical protein
MTSPTRVALVLSLASLLTACSGGARSSGTIGAAGGSVTTPSGLKLSVPAGALAQPTELRIVEVEPGAGAMARIQLEPRDLVLAAPATLTLKVEDGNVRVSEVEHAAEGEVKHQLDKQRHDASGEVEVEVHHLGELEVEHGTACSAACDTGFECDDGVCKADDSGVDDPATHDVGDDHGVDPVAPVDPGAPVVDDHGQHAPGHP